MLPEGPETAGRRGRAARAGVELVAHLAVHGRDVPWPVAVVAESPTTAR